MFPGQSQQSLPLSLLSSLLFVSMDDDTGRRLANEQTDSPVDGWTDGRTESQAGGSTKLNWAGLDGKGRQLRFLH